MKPRFSPKALTFLRSLKKNNDREWFRARKDQYDKLLREPMLDAIGQLAVDFRTFAPDLVADPRKSMFRPYRDTRFSADKTPIKTHIAAVFPSRDLPRLGGAVLYFQIAPDGVWAGGGLHAPGTSQLHAVREHIASNLRRFRTIVESPVFQREASPLLDTLMLQRVPRGFARDHEAAEYLRYKQFLAGRSFPATFATAPRFYPRLLGVFRQVAPLVRFLNEPLLKAGRHG